MHPHTSPSTLVSLAGKDGGSRGDAAGGHQFWSTQPVPQTSAAVVRTVGPMDVATTLEAVPRTPYPIASTFEWWTPDLHEQADLHAVYELLRDNYVEDNDSLFRFNYSEEFLRWALMPPDYVADWHVAIRRKRDGKLLAFISGIPLTMHMGAPKAAAAVGDDVTASTAAQERSTEYDAPRHICEINFLCIHKQLRDKRLAPILIKEVTRRVNLHDKWQAVYTAGIVLPTPFATAQYFHRTLNPEKLIATRFSHMPSHYEKFANPMAMLKRLCQLPSAPRTRNLRAMCAADVPHVARLLRTYLDKYDVHPVFTDAEIQHYLLPRPDVVYTYVVAHDNSSDYNNHTTTTNTTTITDFLSFYCLPSTVIGNSKYDKLRAAYVYYYAATTVPLTQLMHDLLVLARSHGFDVCNLVEILDNRTFLKDLKFSPGDGYLHYYFYNWAYPKTDAARVGLVML